MGNQPTTKMTKVPWEKAVRRDFREFFWPRFYLDRSRKRQENSLRIAGGGSNMGWKANIIMGI